jgi:hypothetical protein
MKLSKSSTTPDSGRSLFGEIFLAAALAALIVVCRVTIDVPNFQPVMAVAMLSGFLFRRQLAGLLATTAGMLLSDALIGFYDWRLTIVVYAALLLPMLGGRILRRWRTESLRMAAGILGFSGLAAVNFYLATNTAVWLCGGWYPFTLTGLGTALLMGLPFLKWTLSGNLLFAVILFGGTALVDRLHPTPGITWRKTMPVPVFRRDARR